MKKKSAQFDYTEALAPHTRKQVFFDCCKVRFLLLFELGALCLLFWSPLLVVSFAEDSYLTVLLSSAQPDMDLYAATRILYSLVKIPCFVLFGIGLSGVVRIIRQMIWGEGIFFWEDFFIGVKQNWKTFCLLFLVLGLASSGNAILATAASKTPGYVFFAVCVMLILPVSIWMLLQTCVYNMKFMDKFHNALRFYLMTFPKSLALLILTLALLSLSVIQVMLVKYVAIVLAVLFLLVPLCMAWLLFACGEFDKHINEKAYPELLNKGLAVEKKEVDEPAPDDDEESEDKK